MESKRRVGVLRRRSDFLELAQKGRRITAERWLVINYKKNGLDQIRCGWTIPKQVGGAVIRNRLKRWCREIIREFTQAKLQSLDINVFVRPVNAEFFKRIQYAQFKESLERGLSTLRTRA